MRECLLLASAALFVLAATPLLPAQTKIEGRYRIELTSGKFVEGEVKEQPDGSYQVKTGQGISVTIQRSQIRNLVPLDKGGAPAPNTTPGAPAGRGSVWNVTRRPITSEEIEQVLSGITAEAADESAGQSDMLAPLPLDEESLAEMLREAGADRQKNVLEKDHFVMVYTSTPESARELGARLEAVWRWNVRFMEMMKLPAQRPEHKLEIYYFGSWEELDRYMRNHGSPLPPGVLGYYTEEVNRAHFFDLATYPPKKAEVDAAQNADWRERQRVVNEHNRWVEYQNTEVIQHEVGHMIHFNIGLFPIGVRQQGASIPTWLIEGTTMLFEVPPSAAGASLGLLNHTRLFQLRHSFGFHPLDPNQWKRFILHNEIWYGMGGQAYPLGWGLVYYLWEKRRDAYANYLQKVFGREEELEQTVMEKEFVDCFGDIDEKWVNEFYRFLDGLELRPSLVDPEYEEHAKQQNVEKQAQRLGRRPPTTEQPNRSPMGGGAGGRQRPPGGR
ncbi:MAG: DUF1570 domain-containing protein [Planctomycetota bacterium]